jgi:hypothetical protein
MLHGSDTLLQSRTMIDFQDHWTIKAARLEAPQY